MITQTMKKERPAPKSRSVEKKDIAGKSLGTVALEPTLFGIEPNEAVLYQVVHAQLAAARSGTQSTKTRTEVRGGGRKPFRQKGTGSARLGTIRSPLWPGGGIALGPKPRSYKQKTPKKMVRLALASALSDRAAEERIALIDAFTYEAPKTKSAIATLSALGISGKVLLVIDPQDEIGYRSFANLPEVQIIKASELSAYTILRNDWVLFTDATLPTLREDGGDQ
jgi:large subunit ribosomal protein L4